MEGLNIEAYDADSLRKMVRLLEYENKILKDKLKKAGISYEEVNPFEEKIESAEEYDLDQGNRIVNPPYITEKMAIRFFSMFWGREDVYARRGKNGGYFPQCANRWNDRLCPKQRKEKVLCDECENTKWISLDVKKIIDHLLGTKEDGSDVIGVYPLLPNGTCRFIVFDFDNHEKGAEVTDFANTDNEWHKEVDALRKMCELNGIRPLVERSRSGKGAHVWIFFKKAIPAATARNFGFLLLDKGSTSINLKSFHYYDRMYPSQDVASSIGNLIALPLQGQALKNGNSALVDENWNAYPDQWDALFNKTRKLGIEDVDQCMQNVFLFLSVGLVAINLILMEFMQNTIEKEERIKIAVLTEQNQKNRIADYQDREEIYERQRRKMHDYKNQLSTIQTLIKNGHTDEALSFTQKLTESIAVEMSAINTNHSVVNAVLNQKYRSMQEKHIAVILKVGDLQEICLEEEEIVILLSNLLDNAIRESEKVLKNTGKAVIHLKLECEEHKLIFAVRNPVTEKVEIENDTIKSKRGDHHGIGLLNVKAVVDKYGGDMVLSCDENEFKAVVIL